MPQRPTTHKDLHRAVIGLVFTLVYLLVMPGLRAQNAPHLSSEGLSLKVEQSRLAKNAPAKPSAAGQAKARAAATKGGKLREIPLATLEAGNAVSRQAPVQSETRAEGKPVLKNDGAVQTRTNGAPEQQTGCTSQKKTVTIKTKKTLTRTTKNVAAPRLKNGLIPPPPPIVPIGMDALGMYAQPVDYLSMKDLEARKKELMVRLSELDSTVTDGIRQIRERRQRAELFESLYQEGVVSRKELEIAKREAGEINRDLKFKQDELESVKVSMKAVNNRLAVLKKMESKMKDGKHKDKKAAAGTMLKSTAEKK
ncbi:MAG: hypothetical protein IT342_09510 [Candidatus Melainabacteria bacterium]|nr:hypothetical protein [Candidatus Melainabacteria bacterium]